MVNFIPRHKSDYETVEVLKATPFCDVRAQAMELLTWVQDINWPVAVHVADYLSPHVGELTGEILEILNGRDDLWKYHLLNNAVYYAPKLDPAIVQKLREIAAGLDESEPDEDVVEIAVEVLERFGFAH